MPTTPITRSLFYANSHARFASSLHHASIIFQPTPLATEQEIANMLKQLAEL